MAKLSARGRKPLVEATRDWTPVRRGPHYCSPACGADCLHVDYLRVKRETEMMAEVLGLGWRPTIWENMGWFGRVVKGALGVRRRGARMYECANWDDQTLGHVLFVARTPRRAVAGCVAGLRKRYAAAGRSIKAIERASKGCVS